MTDLQHWHLRDISERIGRPPACPGPTGGIPMTARPYIFGWLCLVGAIGTAAASDARMTSNLLSLGRSVASSTSFDAGSTSRSGQDSGRDSAATDTARPFHGVPGTRGQGQIPMPPPVDADADTHDGSSGGRSSGPSWQSMLPGSIF